MGSEQHDDLSGRSAPRSGPCPTALEAGAAAECGPARNPAAARGSVPSQLQEGVLSALISSINDEVRFMDTRGTYVLEAMPGPPAGGGDYRVRRLDPTADWEVLRPDGSSRPPGEAPSHRALRDETVTNQTETIRHRTTGEIRWREVSATPVRDRSGAVIGAVSVARDITDRKRKEAAQREGEARIRSVIDHVPGTVVYQIEADPAGARRFTYLSETVESLFGCTSAQALADASLVYRALEAPQRIAEAELKSLLELTPFRTEMRIRTPSGAVRWAYVTSVPRRRDDGSIVWDGIIVDVDEQKRMAAELEAEIAIRQQAQERLRVAQDFSLDAFTILDAVRDDQGAVVDFRWTFVNRAAGRILLHDPQELVGKRLLEVLPGNKENSELYRRYVRVVETGEPHDCEIHYESEGISGWFRNMAVRSGDGVAVSFADITERKRAEMALHAANRQLIESDRRKNHFLAILSHELRNPLAPIANSLLVLDRAAAGSEQARRAQRVIERQVKHMTKLVDDLLDVARVAGGKIQLARERLDLNELARRAAEDHRTVFCNAGVQLQLHPALAPVTVLGDSVRLAQVMGNLLQNAAKFTPPGGLATLSIHEDEPHGHAVIAVRDTGIGIEPEVLPRLFGWFTQAETALDRGKAGLGLGLALVRTLVAEHGGSVRAESAGVGRGAEFTVRLPLSSATPASAPRDHVETGKRRRRVLVIEDNIDAAESLSEVLEFYGHEVAMAHDGPSGIARARDFNPEIVLCDLGLPGMDGFEVARTFRGDPALRHVYLVAVSGYALPADLRRSAESGFDRHVAKPLPVETLEELMAGSRPAG